MSTHPMTNHHVPGIWTHLGETLHIWRHHLGETLHIWRQRYQERTGTRPMDRARPARHWPLAERRRQRNRKTLLAGLIWESETPCTGCDVRCRPSATTTLAALHPTASAAATRASWSQRHNQGAQQRAHDGECSDDPPDFIT